MEIPEEVRKKWLETKRGVILVVLTDMGGSGSISEVVKKCTELMGDRGWRRGIRDWAKRGLLEIDGDTVKIKDLSIDPDYRRIVLGQKPRKKPRESGEKSKEIPPELKEEPLLPHPVAVMSRYGVIQTNDAKEVVSILRQKYVAKFGDFNKGEFFKWLEEEYPVLVDYKEILEKALEEGEN